MLKKSKLLFVMFAIIMSMASCKMGNDEELLEVEVSETPTAETQKFTITYDTNGHATAPEAKTVEEGYKLTEEDLPVLSESNYDFEGWLLNESKVEPGFAITQNITLKAK